MMVRSNGLTKASRSTRLFRILNQATSRATDFSTAPGISRNPDPCVQAGEREMSSSVLDRIPPAWRIGFIGITVLAVPIVLASARSERMQSLADYITGICATSLQSPSPEEAPYLSETIGSMTKMMADMGIQPTGDVDHDFVEMMVPHHQGAIDMAIAVLRYGR